MAVRRLFLSNFRCYSSLRLTIELPIVALTGPNGAGKTNILEAISFLVPGRGLRKANLEDIVRSDDIEHNHEKYWAVAANVTGIGGTYEVGTGVSQGSSNGKLKRAVRIDGVPARGQSVLNERLSVLWVTPEMQRLFTEGPSERRRFLDRLVFGFDPAHAGRLKSFGKSSRERSLLLQNEVSQGHKADPHWLDVLEEIMVEKGVAVSAARLALIDRLNPACAMGVGSFPSASLSINGVLESWLREMPAVEAEDRYRSFLKNARNLDSTSRGKGVGPYISDLSVTHTPRNMLASQCSTGEQKALLISIVLANARLQSLERNATPILLLDEIAAHFDASRRTALFGELQNLGAQVWMTGADPSLFAELSGSVQNFSIDNGKVSEDSPKLLSI